MAKFTPGLEGKVVVRLACGKVHARFGREGCCAVSMWQSSRQVWKGRLLWEGTVVVRLARMSFNNNLLTSL